MSARERERRERFHVLFSSFSPDIVAYCGWRAGSPSDAQDAVAEVFLTAWRRPDELPEGRRGTSVAVRGCAEGDGEPAALAEGTVQVSRS